MAEQRYEAVRAVLADGETVMSVAARFGVSRKTVHQWLARYEAGGLGGLADRSHRPVSCPHQMPAEVEVVLAELRLAHPTRSCSSTTETNSYALRSESVPARSARSEHP